MESRALRPWIAPCKMPPLKTSQEVDVMKNRWMSLMAAVALIACGAAPNEPEGSSQPRLAQQTDELRSAPVGLGQFGMNMSASKTKPVWASQFRLSSTND